MERRDFVAGFVGALASAAAGAQPAPRRYRVGMLDTAPRDRNSNFRALQQALAERGYVEGRNLIFEYRSADGENASFDELARELVQLNVDVIVTRGTPAALAARAATSSIPVVMAAAGDPVGIARDPRRPARNLTGFGASMAGAEGRRIDVLRQLLPKVERVAALLNLSNPSRRAEWNEIAASTRALGITAQALDARNAADIARSFEAASRWNADAMVVGSDTVMQTHQALVVERAAAHRMPAIYTFRDFVEAGGLVSFGVSLPDLYRRAAGYVDKILKGARPSELPVEAPTKFETIINLKAARAIGIEIPQDVIARATEVVR